MPTTRIELARLSTLAPETSASTIPPRGHFLLLSKNLFSHKRAENETRTRDPNLGKVVLYQLSYFRILYELSGLFQTLKHQHVCSLCQARFPIASAKVALFLELAKHFKEKIPKEMLFLLWRSSPTLYYICSNGEKWILTNPI